jgi:SAM-dependent methyltransferase
MTLPDQTEVFGTDEGDNWFRRNAEALDQPGGEDRAMAMLLRLNQREPIRSVCELGCSNGWRLASIAERMPSIERVAGCDLSRAAIEEGCRRWPTLELQVGSLDAPAIDGQFDAIIVNFVFHWVARNRLAQSIAAVDALVRDGGALIIADFLPDRPCARPYHHRTDVEIYTYKQDYAAIFTALGTYTEFERNIFSHSVRSSEPIDPQDRAVCVLLRKSLAIDHG